MRRFEKLFAFLLVVTLGFTVTQLTFLQGVEASSATTHTFAMDRKGIFVVTQNAYLPDRTIFDFGVGAYSDANNLGIDSEDFGLKDPADIHLDKNGHLFIADTGNSRVIVYDPVNDKTIDIITSFKIKAPRGLFITQDNDLYIADSSAHAVFRLKLIDDQLLLDDLIDGWVIENQSEIAEGIIAATDLFRSNVILDHVSDANMTTAIENNAYLPASSYLEEHAAQLGYSLDGWKETMSEEEFTAIEEALVALLADPILTIPEVAIFDDLELGWHIIDTFEKPTSVSFETKSFDPKKVAVDNQDNMYIVAEGLLDGVVQLSDSGEFLGYFASNQVVLTAQQRFEELVLTEEQLATRSDKNPPSFSNVYVDEKGIKYSTSFGEGISNLKKHNTDGSSSIDNSYIPDLSLVDLYTSNEGIIYTASSLGYIHVWTSDGDFIFGFGSQESDRDIAGLYSDLVSIAVDDNGTIWTLDATKNFIQSFTPTEYSTTIYEALTLYRIGEYEQAVEKWELVLKLNQLSVIAHNEIGRNLYSSGSYEEAMYHFELSGNRGFYSDAYWEVRNANLQKNLPLTLLSLVLIATTYYTVKHTNKKFQYLATPVAKIKKIGEVKVINDVLYMTKFIKHPIDSFYDLKTKKKGSYLGATIIFGLFFVIYLVYSLKKGFIYQAVEAEDVDMTALVLGFFGLSLLFVLCNYLVTSINDGEGSIGQIYKGIMYSLLPLMVGLIAVTYLSYIFTFNEVFILDLTRTVGLGWTGLIMFLALQEIHNYTVRNNIKSILMTLLFMAIIIILFAFVQIMGDQLIRFIISLLKEAFRNVFN